MGNMPGSSDQACCKDSATKEHQQSAVRADVQHVQWKDVMGDYQMDMSQDGLMGAGTSSICRKGRVVSTGKEVGIKIYKAPKKGKSDSETQLMKFRRQVEVLKALQEPFVKPDNPRLWCPQLDNVNPARLFMILVDSSTDAKGQTGPDTRDNILYVITELAQYSLKDYLGQRKGDKAEISKATVKDMCKALVMVMAGLHAKGFVHLDLKPENLMVFDGCLKLIDVDGCVRAGMSIAITNPSISFSPCYCSPEWANFLLAENEGGIIADPALDVWSVACTVCEFVTLDAILKPMYANFLRHSHSHREAGFLFMDWLGSIKKAPTPKSVTAFDTQFGELVTDWMFVVDKDARKTCAECLSCPYLAGSKLHHSKTNILNKAADGIDDDPTPLVMPLGGDRKMRHRIEDHSSHAVHTGMLWKLNQGQDANDASQWLQRDMWLANNGSLCYFSKRDEKRLVLLDSHKLHAAEITAVPGLARENAFQIKCTAVETDSDEEQVFVFACTSAEDLKQWSGFVKTAAAMEMMPTMNLGASFGKDLQSFKLSVKNRRIKVENDSEHQFEPVFKGTIWKVKAAGDPMKEAEWFKRDAWVSTNGSLVYWSVREQRELIYYTAADVSRADITKTPSSESVKPFSFQVVLPPNNGMEFSKGEFAAESAEMQEQWIQQLSKFKA